MRKHLTLFIFYCCIITALTAQVNHTHTPQLLPQPQKVVWNIEKQFEPDGFLGLFGNSKINTSRIIPNQHTHNLGFIYVRDFSKQSISISGELKNVFNEDVYNEFKMQSPGRHFRAKITYSF